MSDLENVNGQAKAPVQVKAKKPNKFLVVLFCVMVVVVSFVIQMIVSGIAIAPLIASALREANGDMALYMKLAAQKMSDSSAYISKAQYVLFAINLVLAGIVYYFGYYRREKKAGTLEKVGGKLKNVNSWLFLIVGELAVLSLSIILSNLANSLMPEMSSFLEKALNTSLGDTEWLIFLFAAVVAPISEELMFRGIIVSHSRKAFGIVGCIVISALLFSAYHMNPIQGLYVIPLGVFWGFAAYKFKSVVPGIICHIIQNGTSMLLGGSPIFENTLFLGIVFVVTLVLTIFLYRKLDFLHKDKEVAVSAAN